MRKASWALLGACWLFFLCCGPGRAQETNYMANGDFEKEGDHLFKWELSDENEGSYTADGLVKHSGTYSLRMTPDTKPEIKGQYAGKRIDGLFVVQRSLLVDKGGNYKLVVFLMVSRDYLGKMPRIHYNYSPEGGGGKFEIIDTAGEKDRWLKVERTLEVPELAAGKSVRIGIQILTYGNSGSVWLDDISITKTPSVPPQGTKPEASK